MRVFYDQGIGDLGYRPTYCIRLHICQTLLSDEHARLRFPPSGHCQEPNPSPIRRKICFRVFPNWEPLLSALMLVKPQDLFNRTTQTDPGAQLLFWEQLARYNFRVQSCLARFVRRANRKFSSTDQKPPCKKRMDEATHVPHSAVILS